MRDPGADSSEGIARSLVIIMLLLMVSISSILYWFSALLLILATNLATPILAACTVCIHFEFLTAIVDISLR